MTPPLTDADLLRQFLDATLPATQFHHAEHVRVAWLFLQRDGMPQALTTFPTALKRFAGAHGAVGLYHETITWAFLFLVHERQARAPAADWPDFARANPDLLSWKPSVLDDLYEPATLASELARRTFLLPDRR